MQLLLFCVRFPRLFPRSIDAGGLGWEGGGVDKLNTATLGLLHLCTGWQQGVVE